MNNTERQKSAKFLNNEHRELRAAQNVIESALDYRYLSRYQIASLRGALGRIERRLMNVHWDIQNKIQVVCL